MKKYFLLMLGLIASPIFAIEANTDCSAKRLTAARREVESLITAKQYADVRSKLTLIESDCYGQLFRQNGKQKKPSNTVRDAYFWLQSDALLADLKAGQIGSCIKTGTELTRGRMSAFVAQGMEKKAAGKAILNNLSFCRNAWEKKFPLHEGKACKFSGAEKALEVTETQRAKVMPPITSEACLELVPDYQGTPAQREAQTVEASLCPRVRLWTKKKDGDKPEVTDLINRNGALKDCELTCGLKSLAIIQDADKTLLRVGGPTGPCFGGTASYEYDGVYQWRSGGLELIDEIVIALH